MPAAALFAFSLVLGDDKPQNGQVVDLALFDAVGRLIGEGTATAFADFHMVDFRVIRILDHLERMARMPGLTA